MKPAVSEDTLLQRLQEATKTLNQAVDACSGSPTVTDANTVLSMAHEVARCASLLATAIAIAKTIDCANDGFVRLIESAKAKYEVKAGLLNACIPPEK